MENTINLFRLLHRVVLSTLLILIAAIPLIIGVNMVTAFVFLPLFLIFIFSLSIIIEQKLTTLSLTKTTIKRSNKCLIKNCLQKRCFG